MSEPGAERPRGDERDGGRGAFGPSGVFAFVPVGDLRASKSRMSGVLDENGRRRLVFAMLEDVTGAMAESGALDAMGVATPDPDVAQWADRRGLEVLWDPPEGGLNAAVDRAMAWASGRFRTAVAVLGDLPLAEAEDIRSLVAGAGRAAVALVPDRLGLGTSALAMTPPGRMPAGFGRESRRRHLETARRLGLAVDEIRLPNLALDMDAPSDLWIAWPPRATGALVGSMGGLTGRQV